MSASCFTEFHPLPLVPISRPSSYFNYSHASSLTVGIPIFVFCLIGLSYSHIYWSGAYKGWKISGIKQHGIYLLCSSSVLDICWVQLKLDRPWSQPAYLFLRDPTCWKRSKALLLSYCLLLRIIPKLSLISTPVTVHRCPLPLSFLCSFYRWSTYRSSLQPPWDQFSYYSHSL